MPKTLPRPSLAPVGCGRLRGFQMGVGDGRYAVAADLAPLPADPSFRAGAAVGRCCARCALRLAGLRSGR